MSNIPPSFSFKGDRQKSISLRAQARQFYNFIVNQAELGGVPFINRSLVLSDGSIISVVSKKESIYGHRTGTIFINTAPTIKEVLNEEIFYITLMEPDGTVGYYTNPAQPPYQRFKERRYYSEGEFKLRNDKYAGGQLQRIDNGTFVGTSGSWHNYKDKVVSWTSKPVVYPYARQETFYIDGVMVGLGLAGLTGHTIEQACLKLPELSGTPGATHTLVVLFKYIPVSGPHELRLKIYGVNINTQIITSASSLLTVASYTIGGSTAASFMTTAFSPNGLKFAVLYTESGDVGRQRIYLIDFLADYTAFTITTIYDELVQRVVSDYLTTIIGTGYDWTKTVHNTGGIDGGVAHIRRLKMERSHLAAYSAKFLSYVGLNDELVDSTSEDGSGSGYDYYSATLTSSVSHTMFAMDFSGVVVGSVDIFVSSSSESTVLNLDISAYVYDYSLSATSTTEDYSLVYFSFEDQQAIFLRAYEGYTGSESAAGNTADYAPWSTSNTFSANVKVAYYYKGVTGTNDIDSAVTGYSTSGTDLAEHGSPNPATDYIFGLSGYQLSTTITDHTESSSIFSTPEHHNQAGVGKEFIGCNTTTVLSNPPVDWTFIARGETTELLTYRIDKPIPAANAIYYSPITIDR